MEKQAANEISWLRRCRYGHSGAATLYIWSLCAFAVESCLLYLDAWFHLPIVAASRSSSTFAPERLIGIF